VPRAGHDGELLSRRKRALLTVEHERDPPRPDLYVLGEVLVHMLAAGDKAARFDGDVSDDAGAAALRGGLDDHRLLAAQRVPERRRPHAPGKTNRPGRGEAVARLRRRHPHSRSSRDASVSGIETGTRSLGTSAESAREGLSYACSRLRCRSRDLAIPGSRRSSVTSVP
jgi:hypothetical protein